MNQAPVVPTSMTLIYTLVLILLSINYTFGHRNLTQSEQQIKLNSSNNQVYIVHILVIYNFTTMNTVPSILYSIQSPFSWLLRQYQIFVIFADTDFKQEEAY